MSLKAFHIFFIVVSTVFAVGFGVWATRDYAESGNWVNLTMGLGSFFASIVLVWYGVWFLRKLKGVGYL